MKIFFLTSSRCRGATELRAGQRRHKLSASALHHLNIISPVWCSAHVLEREDWTASENPELGQSGGAGGGGGEGLRQFAFSAGKQIPRERTTELRSEELEDVGWNAAEERLRHCVGHMQGTRWPTDPPDKSASCRPHVHKTLEDSPVTSHLLFVSTFKCGQKWLDFIHLAWY